MKDWIPKQHHIHISIWAKTNSIPILTTNYEESLSSHITNKLTHFDSKSFTDFYPWSSYFSDQELEDPSRSFAIWHINGMQRYARSIRLGLSHYMGSVQRARDLLHKNSEINIFSGENIRNWKGRNTWIHIIFNNDLLIFGLKLDSTEVFLRWLLIERANYFKNFPDSSKKAYYAYADAENISNGQRLFFESVGIELVRTTTYQEIYVHPWE